MEMTSVHDVAVIGAGPVGLSTAYELKRIGLDPLVLEKTSAVGDVWRNHYDGVRIPSQSQKENEWFTFIWRGETE
jgi:putative flavoprotein involved in K+ transport